MLSQFRNPANAITLYRLISSPAIAAVLWMGHERWFIALLTASLISDIADGWVARRFHLQSDFGARLDSCADLITFLLALGGLARFQFASLSSPPRWIAGAIFLALYALLILFGAAKFHRQPSLHTIGFKLSAYCQGFWYLWTFWFGFNDPLFYVAIGLGALACAEEIAILAVLREPRSNISGLFRLLREDQERA